MQRNEGRPHSEATVQGKRAHVQFAAEFPIKTGKSLCSALTTHNSSRLFTSTTVDVGKNTPSTSGS